VKCNLVVLAMFVALHRMWQGGEDAGCGDEARALRLFMMGATSTLEAWIYDASPFPYPFQCEGGKG
jgi:fumarate reductase subunit D